MFLLLLEIIRICRAKLLFALKKKKDLFSLFSRYKHLFFFWAGYCNTYPQQPKPFHEFILILLNCFCQKEADKMFDCPTY